MLAVLVLQIAALRVSGRDWTCPCGTVRLWQGVLDPAENSQQIADPYTLLHVVFGFALCLWLRWIRPDWPLVTRGLAAVASSAVWEVVENLPFVVALFGQAGRNLHYVGDSVINSLTDTLAVTAGFALASRLSVWLVVAAAVTIELVVSAAIGDGFVLGALRLLT